MCDSWSNVITYTTDVDAFSASAYDTVTLQPCVTITALGMSPCMAVAYSSAWSTYVVSGTASLAPSNLWQINSASGLWKATVYLDGVALTGASAKYNPFTFAVNASASLIDTTLSYVADNPAGVNGLTEVTAGTQGTFYAYPFDNYGNAIPAAAVTCAAYLFGTAATVTATCGPSSAGSSYQLAITYTATMAGSYAQSVALLGASGWANLTTGIAANLTVAPGPVNPSGTFLVTNSLGVRTSRFAVSIALAPLFFFSISIARPPPPHTQHTHTLCSHFPVFALLFTFSLNAVFLFSTSSPPRVPSSIAAQASLSRPPIRTTTRSPSAVPSSARLLPATPHR